MDELLQMLVDELRPLARYGRVAEYIPALARVSPSLVAAAVTDHTGKTYRAGEAATRFTIQSISKILTLAYVLTVRDEEAVFARVGMEPTGDPFNSVVRLETSDLRKPFNPMINAGALVVTGLLPGRGAEEKVAHLCDFIGSLIGRDDVAIDPAVFESERASGARNRAIAWFVKDLGLVDGEVEETLDAYFRQCSIVLDVADLSRIGAALALDGRVPGVRSPPITPRIARIVKSLMLTCGLYTGSGAFALQAGIPAKSGVGGGIVATARGRMGVAVFGPALDANGNSVVGLELLIRLARYLDLAAF